MKKAYSESQADKKPVSELKLDKLNPFLKQIENNMFARLKDEKGR